MEKKDQFGKELKEGSVVAYTRSSKSSPVVYVGYIGSFTPKSGARIIASTEYMFSNTPSLLIKDCRSCILLGHGKEFLENFVGKNRYLYGTVH